MTFTAWFVIKFVFLIKYDLCRKRVFLSNYIISYSFSDKLQFQINNINQISFLLSSILILIYYKWRLNVVLDLKRIVNKENKEPFLPKNEKAECRLDSNCRII